MMASYMPKWQAQKEDPKAAILPCSLSPASGIHQYAAPIHRGSIPSCHDWKNIKGALLGETKEPSDPASDLVIGFLAGKLLLNMKVPYIALMVWYCSLFPLHSDGCYNPSLRKPKQNPLDSEFSIRQPSCILLPAPLQHLHLFNHFKVAKPLTPHTLCLFITIYLRPIKVTDWLLRYL